MSATRNMDAVLQPRPGAGSPRQWSFPSVERGTLPNGMAVLLCHLPQREVTSVQLLATAPREQEPPGLDGVAAITASALREGTESHSGDEFAASLERRGATLDTSATHAGIRLRLGVPASRLEPALALMTDALARPSFPEREVLRLVRLRLDAIERELASPPSRAHLAALATLYAADERWSRAEGGTRETVSRIGRDEVVAHHATRLRPANSTAVVVGDLSATDVAALLAGSLGQWTADTFPPTSRTAPQPAPEGQVVVVHRSGAAQTELRLVRVGPTRHQPVWAATSIGNHALGGGMSSRLMRVLREELGYTYGIGARANSMGPTGALLIGGAVETTVTGAAVGRALELVAAIASDGLSQEERDFAVTDLAAVPRRLETAAEVADAYFGLVEEDLPDDYFHDYYPRLEATTLDEANAAAAHNWRSGLNVVAVGDADVISDQLAALNIGEVTRRD